MQIVCQIVQKFSKRIALGGIFLLYYNNDVRVKRYFAPHHGKRFFGEEYG